MLTRFAPPENLYVGASHRVTRLGERVSLNNRIYSAQPMTEQTEQSVDIPPALLSAESLRQASDMPWKARNELLRLLVWPLAWRALRGVEIGAGWRCYGRPIIQRHRRSQIRIGQGLNLRSTAASNPLGANHPVIISTRRPGARLTIGDDFGMTGGSIVCDQRISIGDRVWVGANAVIADTDFHPLDAATRRLRPLDAKTAPVEIGDDVFIGMNALILKGVRIGERAVIGAGSVVRRDVPPGAIAAGNPARVIGEVPLTPDKPGHSSAAPNPPKR